MLVNAAILQGGSADRRFYRIHIDLDGNNQDDVLYGTINLHAKTRFIFLINKLTHLVKTSKNFLNSSEDRNRTRISFIIF